MGKSTISRAMFNSYVKLPVGTQVPVFISLDHDLEETVVRNERTTMAENTCLECGHKWLGCMLSMWASHGQGNGWLNLV